MKRTTKLTLIVSALACGGLTHQSSQAGGIQLYEIGTPDVGLASARFGVLNSLYEVHLQMLKVETND